MVRISKKEWEYLVNNGVKFGENGISRTYSHNVNHYLCESDKNMRLLNKYRKSCIIETHE